jgi:hypothetical protein
MMVLARVVLAAVLAMSATAMAAQEYFVSPQGSDANDGKSLQAPFATIQKAASVMAPGDTCSIRAATYRETVTPAGDGAPGEPLTFAPYKDEQVIISGLEPLAGWEKDENGVWHAPMPGDFFVSTMNQSDQVFIDGKMANLAQWPNPSGNISKPAKSTFTRCVSKSRDADRNMTTGIIEDQALGNLDLDVYKGAEIYVQPNKNAWSWTLSGVVVGCTGKQITFESRNDSGKDGQQNLYPAGARYYLYNHRALLDADGEWYHDKSAGLLYLRTPGAKDPATLKVEAKKREFAFDLTDRSHVVIRGLKLIGCTITTDRAAGGDGAGYGKDGKPRYPWRPKNSVAKSRGVTLENIDASYVSHFTDVSGHFFLQWGQNTGIVLSGEDHVIKSSRVRYSAGNGITLMGRRCKAIDNLVTDVNYMSVDCSAVSTGGAATSQDHEIGYNTIVRCGRSGITYRQLQNSDPTKLVARIHHNDISACMLQDWDGGAMYSANQDAKFLRVDHNLMHDIEGFSNSGFYEDYCRNIIVDHNIMWNLEWPIEIQGDNSGVTNALIYNNTMVSKNTSSSPYGPFGVAGGKGSKAGTIIRNNIIARVDDSKGYRPIMDNVRKTAEIKDNLEWDGKSGSAGDPKFAAMDKGDFTIGEGSAAAGACKPIEEIERDGVKVPAFNEQQGDTIDAGALPAGSPMFKAGCTTWRDAPAAQAGN